MSNLINDHTQYDIRISERQRRILHMAMQEYISARIYHPDDESAELEDMLNPKGSTGPLAPVPGINDFSEWD